ncbi:hypothetical protein [Bifidobacterium sp. SO1]|uniref:hypothetical protein n=1 Tax=Bifidobacterium sp. SO1 TaxID=2809029 RepID=UPI001BDC43CE|nr:hypothetical protein [Bifidobacterium sp. SO1]MBT1162572.1 hypothetical protein [Bifidobacterium sp. SO1]
MMCQNRRSTCSRGKDGSAMSGERQVEVLLETLLADIDADNRPTVEQVALAARIIDRNTDGRVTVPEWFDVSANAIRVPVSKLIEHVAQTRMDSTMIGNNAGSSHRRDHWFALRFWTDWQNIEHRLTSIIHAVDGTTSCVVDKARFLMNTRYNELTGHSFTGFDRTEESYWIPVHGEWGEWRRIVDQCVIDKWDMTVAMIILRLTADAMSDRQDVESCD